MTRYSLPRLLTLIIVLSMSTAYEAAADPNRQLVESRGGIESDVMRIKQAYRTDAAEYVEARKRYEAALDKYNAWAASLKEAIRRGTAVNVAKDSSYEQAALAAAAAANSFTAHVESALGAKSAPGPVFESLPDVGIQIWAAYKDRDSAVRRSDADIFYEDVKWEQWDVVTGTPPVPETGSKGHAPEAEEDEELHLGDPPDGRKGAGESLTIDPAQLLAIDQSVSGESKGPAVDSRQLAMETLKIAKEYAGMGVSRVEPPTPTKVKAFLSLYGLPFRYADSGAFVPYCAAGVGYAAARAHHRLSRSQDLSDDFLLLRSVLPDVTRDYCKTHPATKRMMTAAKARTHANGESFWVSPKQRPEQGWLVFFNWSGGSQPQHVGIVDAVEAEGRVLKTVEFNTSNGNNSNGGRVEPRTRNVRYVVGYIRTYPSAAKGSAGTRRALLIGISDYANGTNSKDKWHNLSVEPDLANMRHVLETYYGFDSENIRIIQNHEATQEEIEQVFRKHLIENVQSNDISVFYFTGHGFQIPDHSDDENADGLDEVLVTWVPQKQQALPPEERRRIMYMPDDTIQSLLQDLVSTMRRRSNNGSVEGNVTVIFDSCHSGSATKGSLTQKGRKWIEAVDGPKPKSKGAGVDPAGGWLASTSIEGVTFISGSQSNQFSYMMPDADKDGSALTYHIAEFLTAVAREASDRQITYDDLFQWVGVKVSGLNAAQTPQIEGATSAPILSDGKPLAMQRLPRVHVLSTNPLRLELNQGSLHGVTAGSKLEVYERNKSVEDPVNRLAEIEITEVRAITSVARISKSLSSALTPEDYEAGQAVMTDHRFEGNPLRVLVDRSVPPQKAKALGKLLPTLEFITRTGVTEADFEVRLGWKTDYFFQRADGSVVSFGTVVDQKTLRERLLAEWRRKRITSLSFSGAPNVHLYMTKPNGEQLDRTPGGMIILRPGDEAHVLCVNHSTQPMFITLVHLDVLGNINTFPRPSQVAQQQAVSPDGKPHHLFTIDGVQEPWGIEIIKMIATSKQTDFSGMDYAAPKGEGGKAKGSESALESILFGVVGGVAKSVNISSVQSEKRVTDQIIYDVQPRDEH